MSCLTVVFISLGVSQDEGMSKSAYALALNRDMVTS